MKVKPASESGHVVIDLCDGDRGILSRPADHAAEWPQNGEARRILVPLDFNQCSRAALLYATQFAGQSHSRIILLHVLPARYAPRWKYDPIAGEQLVVNKSRRAAEYSLARMAHDCAEAGIPVETDVRFGTTASQVAGVARERNIDLIIMGTHGYHGWLRALIGSVAGDVTALAPCPVLIIRGNTHEWHTPQLPGT